MTDLRALEHHSIRRFVESCSEHLAGRVLDYGCGKQPYRDVVEAAGGTYEPFDRAEFPANVSGTDVGPPTDLGEWRDAVLCTQVIQYWPDPLYVLRVVLRNLVRPAGHLILTGPTNWPEDEPEDLQRLTLAGVRRLLEEANFDVVRCESRAAVRTDPDRGVFSLGYGVLARAS